MSKKTSPPKTHVIRIPLPPQKRQQASATKRRKFVDEPMVQPTLFDLDEGGAK